MKICYIDVETSGLDKEKCALLQLSGAIIIGGKLQEEFDFFVKPFEDDAIDPEALEICGFTEEQITSDPTFRNPKDVHNDFTKLLGKYVNKYKKEDKFYLAGYNSHSFDHQFLRQFFLKCGDKYMGSWFFFPSIDIMLIAAYKLIGKRHLLENFKLMTVAKFLGIEVDEEKAHSAIYDIRITRQILLELYKM